MRKLLIGILLGFFLHKGLTGYYNYTWWTSEKRCRLDKREDPFVCIYEDMGYNAYIALLISYPEYSFQQWEWGN